MGLVESRIDGREERRTDGQPRSQDAAVWSRNEVEQMLGVHRCRRGLTLRRWTYDRGRSTMTENMQGGSRSHGW